MMIRYYSFYLLMNTSALIPDDPSEVQQIFDDMKSKFLSNKTLDLDFRQKELKKLIAAYEQFIPQFDAALKQDLGHGTFMTNFSAHSITLGQIRDLLNNFRKWNQPESIPTPVAVGLASSKVQYEPLGVVLVISAWNYPVYAALPQVAAAMCAGNSVILKPSQLSPHTSNVLKKMFDKHFNPDFYRVIEGKVEVAKKLTKLPFDMICFTGSTTTGRLVAIQAAKNLTPCLLELGGKCPVIIDETASIDSAVLRICFGKFLNCGQTCVGVDNVFVHESKSEEFKKKLLEYMKVYDRKEMITEGDYGKINNIGHLNRLESFLQEEHGGKILYGGKIDKSKLYFHPTIIEAPKRSSLLMKEQIFGPIMPINTYKNLKTLVGELRLLPKPLAVYLFSENFENVDFVKKNTSSGAFVVNDAVVQLLNSHLPFGGVGQSGYGRYHGQYGFKNFSNPKSIMSTSSFNTMNRFAPYTPGKKRAINFLMKIGGLTYTQLKHGTLIFSIIVVGAIAGLKIKPKL